MPDLFDDFPPPSAGPYRPVPLASLPLTPIAATADPGTSHSAAEEMVASGRLARQAEIVLRLVREHPGTTYREMHAMQMASDLTAEAIMRRLNDLRAAGYVRNGDARACTVAKRECLTWWLVEGMTA